MERCALRCFVNGVEMRVHLIEGPWMSGLELIPSRILCPTCEKYHRPGRLTVTNS